MTSLESIEEVLLAKRCTLDEVCVELAKIFGVRLTEVGILRVEGELLRFVHPAELNSAGCIPISGSAVAGRTASSKTSVLHNNFANVPHHDVFELIKLKDPKTKTEDPPRIQKLISSPILGEGDELLGVVQVSRKGLSPSAAGPDFDAQDVTVLERAARRIATLRPEVLLTDFKKPVFKLELQNEQQKQRKRTKTPNTPVGK
jgi:hypothetical protein